VIDQSTLLKSPKVAARFDLIEMGSGLLLVLFMWGHMLMLATILLGENTMNGLATFLEDLYLAQVGAVGVAFLILIHFVAAGRKLPSRILEMKLIWRLTKKMRHTDTWLWLIQVVTGLAVLLFVAIHLWIVLTTFPIEAAKSSTRVAQALGYLYLPMVLLVELHVGIGLYRVIVKWTGWNRHKMAFLKWGLTAAFLVIGYAILAAFWSFGSELLSQ
jgi:fumarate reductase subunit C